MRRPWPQVTPRARAWASLEEATREADTICLCTSASQPLIRWDWLNRGMHITSVGYMPPGGELDRAIAEQGHLFVETRQAFAPPPGGSSELTGLDPNAASELGEVLLGTRPGRLTENEVTVYKSMGHAMEDLVSANLVYRRARDAPCLCSQRRTSCAIAWSRLWRSRGHATSSRLPPRVLVPDPDVLP
jgi:alanine dehydrogenase